MLHTSMNCKFFPLKDRNIFNWEYESTSKLYPRAVLFPNSLADQETKNRVI